MRILVGPLLILLAACQGTEPDAGVEDTDSTIPVQPPEEEDTGWPPGQVGHMHLNHDVVGQRTRVYGMFSQSAGGLNPNVSQCAIEGSICFPPFPPSESHPDNPAIINTDKFDQENVSTVFVGFEIALGPYIMNYVEEPENTFGSYSSDVTGQPLPLGWVGVSWGGSWKPYAGTEDLFVSPPIELISPAADSHIRFTNGEQLVIEWLPTGEGTVTIAVAPESSDSLLFIVEDDGYKAFDVDLELGLSNDTEEIGFTISRWNINELRKYGHVVDLVASSDATFTSTYNNIGTRTRILPADDCTEAQGSAALGTGGYWGFLDPLVNDLDPIGASADCPLETLNSDSRGKEGLVRLEIDPYESVNVDYNTYDPLSAATYLLEDCNDIQTCIISADVSDTPNVHEFVNYFNTTDDTQTLYLGLDSSDKDDGVFTLDLEVTELADPEMYDLCEDAQDPTAVVTGGAPGNWTYFETFTSYTADSNPGLGLCTETSLPGNDAILVIEVPTATTLSVLVTMANADPGIYLLFNCSNEFQCAAASDASLGPEEKFTYQNQSAATERLYLVVDSKSGLQPFFLSVSIL